MIKLDDVLSFAQGWDACMFDVEHFHGSRLEIRQRAAM